MTPDLLITPWTDAEVDALARYQLDGRYHPYTCGNELHGAYRPVLVPTYGGWSCESYIHRGTPFQEECFYIQQWAHKSSLTM